MNRKNKYNEIITEIEVTEDMKERILSNINKMDFDLVDNKKIKKYKFNYKKYVPIAAIFTILVVGAVMTHNLNNIPNEIAEDPIVSSPMINEYKTLDEMTLNLGFEINEIETLPFEASKRTYLVYFSDMGEIAYEGNNNTVFLRKGLGQDDISGYYGEDLKVETYIVNDIEVILKSKDEKYMLAIWKDKDYSYSIQFTEGTTSEELIEILESYIK